MDLFMTASVSVGAHPGRHDAGAVSMPWDAAGADRPARVAGGGPAPRRRCGRGRLRHPQQRASAAGDDGPRLAPEEKRLKKLGADVGPPAEHFYVTEAKGPLADGEVDRARRWGQ